MVRVLEFHYTDIDRTYQILLTKQGSEVITENFKPYATRIETPYSLWRSISRNEISGKDALFQRLYKVIGDFNLMLKWDELFGTSAPPKGADVTPSRKTNKMEPSALFGKHRQHRVLDKGSNKFYPTTTPVLRGLLSAQNRFPKY